jgi:flagellar basal-body rod protein FlgC
MNLFGVMDVSGSALKAERVRAEVVAANMANAETTRTADGTPYRRQQVVFAQAGSSFADAMHGQGVGLGMHFASLGGPAPAAGGVEVAGIMEDNAPPLMRYEPGHPDADKDGYVSYPDINPLTEMVDLMGATRAYGANASALTAEKNMVNASLDILKS